MIVNPYAGSSKAEQEKTITITNNCAVDVLPDVNKVLSAAHVIVDVPAGSNIVSTINADGTQSLSITDPGLATSSGISDLRNWQFLAGANFDAQIQISYDSTNDLNTVTYTGSSGFERLLFLSAVKPNKTYRFSFTMECEETLTYWNPNEAWEYAFVTSIPYSTSYPTADIRNLSENYVYNRVGGTAKTGNFVNTPNTPTVYSCNFVTASYQVIALLWIDFGSLTDGVAFHFKFSNIILEEVT